MRHIFPGAFPPPPPEPCMPVGLVQLMEGLSRDVIMHNPADVYKFCAEHMHKLLLIRDATQQQKSLTRVQAKVCQRARQPCERHIREKKYLSANIPSSEEEAIPSADLKSEDADDKCSEEHNENNANLQEMATEVDKVSQLTLNDTVNHQENQCSENENPEIKIEAINTITIEEVTEKHEIERTEGRTEPTEEIPVASEKNNTEEETSERYFELQVFTEKNNESGSKEARPQDDKEELLTVENINQDTEVVNDKLVVIDFVLYSDLNDVISNVPFGTETVVNNLFAQDNESFNGMENVQDGHINADFNTQDEISSEKIAKPELRSTKVFDEKVELNSLQNTTEEENKSVDNGDSIDITSAIATEKSDIQCPDKVDSSVFKDKDQTNSNDNDIEDVSMQKLSNECAQLGNKEQTSENIKQRDIKNDVDTKNALNDAAPISVQYPIIADEDTVSESEIIEKREINEDAPHVVSVKSTVDDHETTSEELSKQETVDWEADLDQHNTLQSTLTDTPNKTVNEESTILEFSNETEDKVENGMRQNTEMDLETAAVTIQKVFRSFLMNRASTLDDVSNEEYLDAAYLPSDVPSDESRDDQNSEVDDFHNTGINKERRGLNRIDSVLQTVNEEKSLSLSDDSSTLSSAATIIQAHVRGFLVRNRMQSHKTTPTNSTVISDCLSASMDTDTEQSKNKTILNIHIVPEGGHYLSRDESMAMSMDLPLDGSPPTSAGRHSIGYDITERRKLLKREDAVQSISPPSNNSGNGDLSVKEIEVVTTSKISEKANQLVNDNNIMSGETTPTESTTVEAVLKALDSDYNSPPEQDDKMSSDEKVVVTSEEKVTSVTSDDKPRLIHSGEFHELVLPLPTKISRSDSPVVREFQNVLGYFLIWN